MNVELTDTSNSVWLESLRAVEEKTYLSGESLPPSNEIGQVNQPFSLLDPTYLRSEILSAAWSVLLQRYLRSEEQAFVFYTSDSVQMFPVLIKGKHHDTFRTRIQTITQNLKQSRKMQATAEQFARLYTSGKVERPYNTGIGLNISAVDAQILESSSCDLFIEFSGSDQIQACAYFRKSSFSEEFVQSVLNHLQSICIRMMAAPDSSISEEDLLSESERQLLLHAWSGARKPFEMNKPVHHWISERAALAPDQDAVVYEGGTLSYGELDRRSDILASELRSMNLGSGQVVGILARPSAEMILSILAVLKTGAAYLPIDPEYPAERIRFMLEDSQAPLLLLTPHIEPPSHYTGHSIRIDNDRQWDEQVERYMPGDMNEAAYVIYTSGSTGKPKGVVVEHRSLMNFAKWHIQQFEITPQDRSIKYAGFGFDASVWEIFPYLMSGSAIYMIPEELRLDPEGLNTYFDVNEITIAFLPTQLCEQFFEYDNHSLRILLTGGDKLKTFTPRSYDLYNCYGPTENTIVTSFHLVTQMEDNIPIGKPIRGSQIMILDTFGHLQPIGVAGELCVAGDGLARGYLNRPELTEEKFTVHPYVEGARMYRTGDLARWKRDGTIEFLGRLDHQVKIRGFRIEIGEIEQRILENEHVQDCVVVASHDESGDAFLTAYIQSAISRDYAEWTDELSVTLPDYMIPAYWVTLDQLPVNANGKIDRRALPKPQVQVATQVEEPSNDRQQRLYTIWSEVLGHDRFGVSDRFFDIGGHSLQAAILRAKIEHVFGARFTIRELFEYTTIKLQADQIAERRVEHDQVLSTLPSLSPALPAIHYPTYPAQTRLFLIEQMEGAGTAYNAPVLLRVQGELDLPRLEKTLQTMVERHEALRTSFELRGEQIIQQIHPQVTLKLAVSQAEEKSIHAVMDTFVRPFDLSQAPLMRAGVVSCDSDLHFIMLDFHHIAVDGVSMHLFFEEWSQLYRGKSLEDPALQFKDFSVWYRQDAAAFIRQHQLDYWQKRLAGELPMLQLPTDKPRSEKQSFRGATLHYEIDAQLHTGLKRLAERTDSTLFMVMLATYGTLLSRYSGQEDVIVGVPVANRSQEEVHSIIGMFVNTLPMRTYPEQQKTFAEYLSEVKSELLRAFDHQEYELGELVKELNIPRIAGRSPLFDTMFVMQNTGRLFPQLEGVQTTLEHYAPAIAKYDLMLDVTENDTGIVVDFQYCSDLFEASTIERLAEHYMQLLRSAVENEHMKLPALPMLSATEQHKLVIQLNDTTSEYDRSLTIQAAFEQQAMQQPNSIAIVFEDQSLTYAELNEKANSLAYTLIEQGVTPDQLVGLMLDRSPEMIIGLLGILKAGGAYVPIDPEYPEDRIRYMMENSGSDLLLTQRHLAHKLQFAGKVLCIDEAKAYSQYTDNPEPRSKPSDLLYVIYTSGTTGRPKGVMLEHRNMMNLIHYEYTQTNIDYRERVLQFTTLSFDVCSQEIWSTLLAGGTLCMIRSEMRREVGQLLSFIEQQQISVLFMPVSFLKFILSEKEYEEQFPTCIRHIVTAGEQLVVPEKFQDHLRRHGIFLHNHYGPSETHVATAHTVYPSEDIPELPPIGRPIANTRIYLLNSALHVQPQGVAGELYIAGECVGRGYYNQPELTEERYLADPFEQGSIMYKTGDLARWTPNGELEFLGRLDHQVKIRGFRIELGEIETALLEHESVKETIVLAKEDAAGGKYLCAYVASPTIAHQRELREHLAHRLPDYMVPSYFVSMDKMPLTPNGKIDRRALLEPKLDEIGSGTEYEAPQNEIEQQIAEVWQRVLGIGRIGRQDNFFELGGHSLKAAVMVARLQEHFELSINDVFEHQVLAELANVIKPASNRIVEKLAELKEAYLVQREDTLAEVRQAYMERVKQDVNSVDLTKLRGYRNVLLTGATGYVGIHLLYDMLTRTDWEIFVVVRGDNDEQAYRRVQHKLKFYFGEQALTLTEDRLHVLHGDLSEERIGLSEEAYTQLQQEIDVIVHAAATVKHYGNYDDFKRHNVEATEQLLQLADSARRKDFHHISTLGVATGIVDGQKQAFFGEYDLDLGQRYENYYAKTKFEAEELVIAARAKGIQTSIYRLGNVVFHSKTGRFQENIGENAFYTMMQSFLTLGIVPELSPDTDFSYVDGISASILLLMQPEQLQNQIFHLLNPHLESMYRILTTKNLGYEVKPLKFAKFVDELTQKFESGESRVEIDKIMLHYGWLESAQIQTSFEIPCQLTVSYLEQLGFQWKAIDDILISKMIDYAKSTGFLK
ncbi:non-ribosomal peptide synthetase [Saccharibacillus sp. JS10]|uniref:non-ribosomal peptide synthetase n=1 Tax=Saccharibacillus sp. JS10 TaxID=2950552 RepID=UPI00210CBB0D|nr:non-ribosomal peptide synthetase [Saccharibacillus sp. JS10]MCQ4088210.1 amino acid adenylation domain-containing protein [Saccharibacillus sp. JS10]